MRKPSAILIALVGLPAAAVAQAPAARTFAVSANVPGACAVGLPTQRPAAQVNFRGLSGSTLQIERLVDPTTLSTNAASAEVVFPASCAFPHRLKVETQRNGLWPTGERAAVRPDGFADAVPYRASVEWAAETLRISADAQIQRMTDGSVYVEGGAIGDILLRLEIDAGATNAGAHAPLLAGIYGDTIRITLEPQQ